MAEEKIDMQKLMAKANDPELAAKVNTFMSYLNKARDLGELDLFLGLFQVDYRIMQYLKTHQNAHPSEMAEALKESRPNIAANLRILEQKGYIKRELDQENRRQVYVNVTEEGLGFLHRCDLEMMFLFSGWFQLLGEEEVKHLFHILEVSTDAKVMSGELKNFRLGD